MPVQTHWQDTCSTNLRPDLHPGADSVPLGGNTHRLSEARLPLPAPPPAPGSPDLPAARLQPSICRADHTALCALLYASRLDTTNAHSLINVTATDAVQGLHAPPPPQNIQIQLQQEVPIQPTAHAAIQPVAAQQHPIAAPSSTSATSASAGISIFRKHVEPRLPARHDELA